MAKFEQDEQMLNVISKGTSIKGDVISDGDMRVDGMIEGNLIVKGKLFMGQTGMINGTIASQDADLAGSVIGNINVKGLLTLLSESKIKGDLKIGQLSIEPGAQFSGHCSMGEEPCNMQEAVSENISEQYN